MNVDISDAARRYITRKGGDLFIWTGEMGASGSLFERVSTRRPRRHHVTVAPQHEHGIRVWLDTRKAATPTTLVVRRRPWPLGPITVSWQNGPGGEFDRVNIHAPTHWP